MRDHPLVRKKSHEKMVGYDEAEALVRYEASRGDQASAEAVKQIDAANVQAKADALALSKDMVSRLGLDLDGAAKLVAALAGDAELETWLARRVQLHKAHGKASAHDEHPCNE